MCGDYFSPFIDRHSRNVSSVACRAQTTRRTIRGEPWGSVIDLGETPVKQKKRKREERQRILPLREQCHSWSRSRECRTCPVSSVRRAVRQSSPRYTSKRTVDIVARLPGTAGGPREFPRARGFRGSEAAARLIQRAAKHRLRFFAHYRTMRGARWCVL